jgi:type IV fimbrial biogenesis protein FimT
MIEILVVLTIMGILLRLATLQFSSLTLTRNITKAAQQLVTDLHGARTQAMYSKQRTSVTFPSATSYSFARYSSANDGAGTVTATNTVKYSLTAGDGSSIIGKTIVFDKEGMATYADLTPLVPTPFTVRVNPTNSGATADCLLLETARTSLGRMVNGSCVIK